MKRDGVNRRHRLNTLEFGLDNPTRWHVIKDEGGWRIYCGGYAQSCKPTFVQAVQAAHRYAGVTQR